MKKAHAQKLRVRLMNYWVATRESLREEDDDDKPSIDEIMELINEGVNPEFIGPRADEIVGNLMKAHQQAGSPPLNQETLGKIISDAAKVFGIDFEPTRSTYLVHPTVKRYKRVSDNEGHSTYVREIAKAENENGISCVTFLDEYFHKVHVWQAERFESAYELIDGSTEKEKSQEDNKRDWWQSIEDSVEGF